MKKNLLIIGAGQFGQVTKEIAISSNKYNKIDFLDDESEIAIGKISDYKRFTNDYQLFVVAIGNTKVREKIVKELSGYFKLETVESPKAFISESASIGEGCIIEPFAFINANSLVGKSSFICAHSIINHNSKVGNYCHINCGAIVKSNSIVSDYSKIDYGEIV